MGNWFEFEGVSGGRKFVYDTDEFSFYAIYVNGEIMAAVVDTTCDEVNPSQILMIEPRDGDTDFEPQVKWDVILQDDFGIDPNLVRPKEKTKYKKLDINYQSLQYYDEFIKTGDAILLGELKRERLRISLGLAYRREEQSLQVANRAKLTLGRTEKLIIALTQKVVNTNRKLARAEAANDEVKQAELTQRLYTTTEKLKRAQRRLKRAEKRFADSERELAARAEQIALIRELIARLEADGGASILNHEIAAADATAAYVAPAESVENAGVPSAEAIEAAAAEPLPEFISHQGEEEELGDEDGPAPKRRTEESSRDAGIYENEEVEEEDAAAPVPTTFEAPKNDIKEEEIEESNEEADNAHNNKLTFENQSATNQPREENFAEEEKMANDRKDMEHAQFAPPTYIDDTEGESGEDIRFAAPENEGQSFDWKDWKSNNAIKYAISALLSVLLIVAVYLLVSKDDSKKKDNAFQQRQTQQMPVQQPVQRPVVFEQVEPEAVPAYEPPVYTYTPQPTWEPQPEAKPAPVAAPRPAPAAAKPVARPAAVAKPAVKPEVKAATGSGALRAARDEYMQVVIGKRSNENNFEPILVDFENLFDFASSDAVARDMRNLNRVWNRFRNATYHEYYRDNGVLRAGIDMDAFAADEALLRLYSVPNFESFERLANKYAFEFEYAAGAGLNLFQAIENELQVKGRPAAKLDLAVSMHRTIVQMGGAETVRANIAMGMHATISKQELDYELGPLPNARAASMPADADDYDDEEWYDDEYAEETYGVDEYGNLYEIAVIDEPFVAEKVEVAVAPVARIDSVEEIEVAVAAPVAAPAPAAPMELYTDEEFEEYEDEDYDEWDDEYDYAEYDDDEYDDYADYDDDEEYFS
ncbi:MAG: hypothetical protein FWD15_03555 [Alphaproteobacteria bacterium]|nr:hypothetical protein [Alphaproteobacteria bacterium]